MLISAEHLGLPPKLSKAEKLKKLDVSVAAYLVVEVVTSALTKE
jgi:hypothetical protein